MPAITRRFTKQSSTEGSIPSIDEITASGDTSWHPDHVRSRRLDAEEKLHLQSLWLSVYKLWLIVGNLALWSVAILADVLNWPIAEGRQVYIFGLALLSLALSPTVTYFHYKRVRKSRLDLKKLALTLRAVTEQKASDDSDEPDSAVLARQKRYREETLDVISQYRDEANRNRRTSNRIQSIVIVGSIGASAVTTASVSFNATRWVSVAITTAVGLAAGFAGYFKFHERSFNLQQTADGIEREYEAVDLRVGKYSNKSDKEAYSLFADTVERLRDEQNKRQQQLDQPVEVKREE